MAILAQKWQEGAQVSSAHVEIGRADKGLKGLPQSAHSGAALRPPNSAEGLRQEQLETSRLPSEFTDKEFRRIRGGMAQGSGQSDSSSVEHPSQLKPSSHRGSSWQSSRALSGMSLESATTGSPNRHASSDRNASLRASLRSWPEGLSLRPPRTWVQSPSGYAK